MIAYAGYKRLQRARVWGERGAAGSDSGDIWHGSNRGCSTGTVNNNKEGGGDHGMCGGVDRGDSIIVLPRWSLEAIG